MSSISGGGRRVGGPPDTPPPTPAQPAAKKDATEQARQAPASNDEFQRGMATPKKGAEAASAPMPGLKPEMDAKFNEMLKQTRNDPKALSQLANTLNLAYNRFLADFQGDRVKAGALLDKLVLARFSQASAEHMRSELGSLRERMSITRQRMATQKRRLRALKQLAGRVSESRLAEEIAGIEARIEMLDTGWAESFVGLGLGKVVYQPGHEETPEHLKRVVKATVQGTKRNHDAAELGELVSEIHPARIATGVAAREIDGAQRRISEEVMQRIHNETGGSHGRAVQAYAALYELFENSEDDA